MKKITNLTNSPFEIHGLQGKVILPAFGSIETDLQSEYLTMLEMSNAVKIDDAAPSEPVTEAPRRGRPPKAKDE